MDVKLRTDLLSSMVSHLSETCLNQVKNEKEVIEIQFLFFEKRMARRIKRKGKKKGIHQPPLLQWLKMEEKGVEMVEMSMISSYLGRWLIIWRGKGKSFSMIIMINLRLT